MAAVIHSHSPAVIPFGVTQVPMQPVYHQATFLYAGVPVWEIRDVDNPDAAASWCGTHLSANLSPKSLVTGRWP